jgi:hypothetical protein
MNNKNDLIDKLRQCAFVDADGTIKVRAVAVSAQGSNSKSVYDLGEDGTPCVKTSVI